MILSNGEELLHEIRKELFKHDLSTLATRIGVGRSALYHIRSGRTKWPRETTLFCIIHGLGMRLTLSRPNSERI